MCSCLKGSKRGGINKFVSHQKINGLPPQSTTGDYDTVGRAYTPKLGERPDKPFGWVAGDWAPGFVHEVAHIFGAKHDRANTREQLEGESRFGLLLKGSKRPRSTGAGLIGDRTIMAYADDDYIYEHTALRFSQDVQVEGKSYRFGNAQNRNNIQIRMIAKSLAEIGNETCQCGDTKCFAPPPGKSDIIEKMQKYSYRGMIRLFPVKKNNFGANHKTGTKDGKFGLLSITKICF